MCWAAKTKYGRLSVVVFILVSLGCSGAFLFDDNCGGEPYDKETEICCNGVKHPMDPNSECCAGSMIDTRASTCHLGVIVTHDNEVGCDGVYYKKEEQLCCDGKLTERDRNIECCNGELMDTRASYCDWGMIISNRDENGCDNIYYKRDEQVCCHNKLYPNTKYTECCAGQIMDTRAAVCLLGMVVDTRNGNQCFLLLQSG
ncbi:hypothetical protein NP493_249g12028 [Ridgeia piscesae]|uniref:Galaxin-like repeats domain-containing protein n=1 Tax=Ridgeia piscesae TaxID=27915 RepID=A0AAD9NYT3_RIDPI|nr:hypothetical protein NP493_249g12028 [Ridgeia piscesae]